MLAAVPAILESGTFLDVPLWIIGSFFGAAFALIIVAMLIAYIFSGGEEHHRPHRKRIREESPQDIIDEFKEKYGVTPRSREGLGLGVVVFALIFLAFLGIVGYLLGRYFQEGEPKGQEFVPFVQEAIVQPLINDVSERINLKR